MKETLIPQSAVPSAPSERFRENLPLLRRAANGDESAVADLFILNGGLVNHIALRFLGRGTDYEDLAEIGKLGLLKAIRTFDESRGCAFSTYAVPLIFGEIRRFLRDDGLIKVSRAQKKLAARLAAERERLEKAGEIEIRLETLAKNCDVTPEEAASALDATCAPASLSDLLYDGDGSLTLENTLCDEEENERAFHKIAIAAALKKLPELQRKIILLRYYRDRSQEETARALGLSQVKISREEKKILAFLREELS